MNDSSGPATLPVLLVEHYLPLANAVIRGLREEGIDVHLAATDVECEAQAWKIAYAAIVVDWRIPHQGGAELVRRYRRAGLTAPVLMLLPFANGTDLVEALEAGADDVLPLPFSFAELLLRVRACVKSAALAPAREVRPVRDVVSSR